MKKSADARLFRGAESYSPEAKADGSHQAVLAHVLRNSAPCSFKDAAGESAAERLMIDWPMFEVKILPQGGNTMVTRMLP